MLDGNLNFSHYITENYLRLIDISFILFLSVSTIFSIPNYGIISPTDTEFPVFPEISFIHSLFQWSDFNNGNPNVVAMVHDMPINGATLFLQKLGLPLLVINRLWLMIPLFFVGLSGYYFSLSLISDQKKRYIGLITSFLLIYSVPTICFLALGWSTKNLLPFAFNIFLLSFFIRGLKKNRSKYYLILGGFSSVFAIMLPNFLVLSIVLLFIYLILNRNANNFVYCLMYILLIFIMNFWFFLPFLKALTYGFQYYSVDPFVTIEAISSFNNALRTLTLRNLIPPLPLTTSIFNTGPYLASLCIVTIGFTALLVRQYRKEVLFLSTSLLFLLIIAGGNTPPFGSIYMFLFKNVPLFYVFRETSKINYFLMIIFSILFSMSILVMYKKIISFKFLNKPTIKLTLILFILFLGFLNSYPLGMGNVGGAVKSYEVPDYYIDYHNYMKLKNSPNTLILPMPRWFSNFVWYKDPNNIVNIIRSTSPSPIVYDEINQSNLNAFQLELSRLFITKQSNEKEILSLLNILGISYILIQNDQLNEISPGKHTNESLENIRNTVQNLEYLYKEKSFGQLDLYKLSDEYFVPKIHSVTTPILIDGGMDQMFSVVASDNFAASNSALFLSNSLSQNQIGFIQRYDNSFIDEDLPQIIFKKINPTKYQVKINATRPFFLVFSENYHSQWKAYVEDKSMKFEEIIVNYESAKVREARHENKFTPDDIPYMFAKYISDDSHFLANGYANAWYIHPKEVDKNNDGEFTITLFFLPQSLFYFGLMISGTTFFVSVVYLIYNYRAIFFRISGLLRWRKRH